jgi:predicted RNA-binding protein
VCSFKLYSGSDLLSRDVPVPSALEGLTAVFGMGTGVAPPL